MKKISILVALTVALCLPNETRAQTNTAPPAKTTVAEGVVVVVVVATAAVAIWQIWRAASKLTNTPTNAPGPVGSLTLVLPDATTNNVTLQYSEDSKGGWANLLTYQVQVTSQGSEATVTAYTQTGQQCGSQTVTVTNGVAFVRFDQIVPAPQSPQQFYRLTTH